MPLKVKVFSWLALKDKILTRANLIKRGWQGPPGCGICGNQEATVLHIFFHCSFAQAIWNFLLRDPDSLLPEISLTQVFSLQQHLLFQINSFGWNTLLLGIFWSLWLNRNEAIFKTHIKDITSIFWHILSLSSFWLDHGHSVQGENSFVIRSMQAN